MHRLVLGNPLAVLVAPILVYVVAHKLLNKRRASAPTNAEDPNPGAPSRSIPAIKSPYDVFLSFRGVDTRKCFADHLCWSFRKAGIDAFWDDDEVHQGDGISPDLLEAIKNSKILIPIISRNYASSKWCLQELVYMMECKKRSGGIVWPVFYRVEPSDVRYKKGSFGEAFRYYWKRFGREDVQKWEQALTEVTYLQGWESEKVANGHEGELVERIVRRVLNNLSKEYLVVNDCLVGIDSHVDNVMELINKDSGATLFVGIYGMGGIGKTTLVKVIYNMLSNQFESCAFIVDIRESCKRNGILYLQNELISNLLRKKSQLYDYEEGIKIISSRCAHMKVLLILDDVATCDELKALAGNRNWFGAGSRILITTRNKSVLDWTRVDIQYELEQMDEEQSLVLFSRHAFRRDSPIDDFLALSQLVVSTIGGLPLALEVMGSYLAGKQKSIWRDVIQGMQKVPHGTVQKKLKISYDGLDIEEKEIFLDIACFLIGSDARVASYMWDACDFFPKFGIEVLRSRSLINIGDNYELKMHNQVRDLGREIVRQENYIEPHQRSRLWDYEEALKVLEENKGTLKIEAIYLENSYLTRIAEEDSSGYVKDQGSCIFTNEQFRNLLNLRFLHMSDVNLIGDFKNTFSKLTWLKWGNCPPTFEAINFHPKKLVILDLSGSLISDHWRGWSTMMLAEKLKVLNLSGCRSLKSTSYVSAFQSLEILILRDCGELEEIDPCIGDVETLISLDLSGCLHLKELLPQVGKLEQLRELLLDKTLIQEIPPSIGSLEKLEILSAKDCKSLLELPDSIGRLVNLRCLSLRCCHQLREIPASIGKLEMLTRLDLSGCSCIKELPSLVCELGQLKELLLDQTMIQEIPSSFGSLKKLETLSAKDCKLLLGLPDSIGDLVSLSTLVLSGCVELVALPESIGALQNLEILNISHTEIQELPNGIGRLRKLRDLDASRCTKLRGSDRKHP